MKHEAGGVLGEVKRKQTEATKAVELLKALRKLREARKQEAEVKGIIKKGWEHNRFVVLAQIHRSFCMWP